MTSTDYLISLAGLAFLLWNMRRSELSNRRIRRSFVVAGAIAFSFLHTIPTAGSDTALIAAGALLGIACGGASALFSKLDLDGATRTVFSTGTPICIAITTFAFGSRMAFAFASDHGAGPAIAHLSRTLDITSEQAWVTALVLMAVGDIAARAAVLLLRRERLTASAPAPVARPVVA